MDLVEINIERFLSKIIVTQETGCWDWSGYKNTNGYGHFSHYENKKQISILAHRVSFSIFKEPLVDGLVIDHQCRNRACVNPDHLRQVTQRTNATENSSGVASNNLLKTHCTRNHVFSSSNTYTYLRNGNIQRVCRACRRENQSDYLLRKLST